MKVRFDSDIETVEVNSQTRLLDVLLERQVKVKMLCGGRGICATCHVYITKNPQNLTPLTNKEKTNLLVLTGAQHNSRLACQCQVVADNIEVALPEGLYVESFAELEALVGQRTTVPILHPVNGDILIAANKIIVRTIIMSLRDVDFDISRVKLNSK